jgi:Ca2+-binding RTX toxin-like protein
VTLTAAEQFLLELINRARLNPLAEAARLGIDLNQGLSPGQLTGTARQVLAPNAALEAAATQHSLWMLAAGVFSHTGAGGSQPWDRAAAQGYAWSAIAENISWRGTSAATIDLNAQVQGHHDGLFRSAGHRVNLMNDGYREVGLGQEAGEFTAGGTVWRASMLTELFGQSGRTYFLTGVVYGDGDGDGFYSIGEGHPGAAFWVAGAAAVTAAAGGYALQMMPAADVLVTGNAYGQAFALRVDLSAGNVKLDLVDGQTFATSGNVQLVSGIDHLRLLGVAPLAATGSAAGNRIDGNAGANRIDGQDGNDRLSGNGGADRLSGGNGNDFLRGGPGNDRLAGGPGKDRLDGGDGADRLAGGPGSDVLTGGAGADRFVLAAGDGSDRVTDLSLAEGDRLLLHATLWGGGLTAAAVVAAHAEVTAAGVLFDFGTDRLLLEGVTGLTGLAAAIDIL